MGALFEEIDPDYYKDFICIDSHIQNTRMHNPKRLYTAL